jgi:hypothetical protein
MFASQREAKEAAAAVREEEREKRRAERDAERAERDAGRDAKRSERDGVRRKEQAEREAKQGVRKRIPAVSVGALSGGWGELADVKKGAAVEVRLSEEGLDGSIYSGTLAQRAKSKAGVNGAWVVFDELLEEDSENQLLRDWVQMQDVRRKPPTTPAGFARLVEVGDAVEFCFEDGWWEVEVEKVQRLKPGETLPQQQGVPGGEGEDGAPEEMHAAALEGMDTGAHGEERTGGVEGGNTEAAGGAALVTGKDAAMQDVRGEGEAGGDGASCGGWAEPTVALKAMGSESAAAGGDEQGAERPTGGGMTTQKAKVRQGEEPNAKARRGEKRKAKERKTDEQEAEEMSEDVGGGAGGERDAKGASGEAADAQAMGLQGSQSTSMDPEASAGRMMFHVRSVKYKAMHVVDASQLRPLWLWSGPEGLWRYEIEAGHGYATDSAVVVSDDAGTKDKEGGREVAGPGDVTAMFRFARGIPRSHNDGGSRAGVGTIYDALDHL